ncbi:hypothetical protein KIPB_007547 [Kipferlia bialata]|uniref:Protein kinase domain-containing protein n=1 Tax=Kipferlia bialata TaxID=797122 RepID=A0A9K3CYY7_9EUKA|nr:hypothetical protein KIPB_007547 [Kipferlia bialata]|eukprot:g7547.t1
MVTAVGVQPSAQGMATLSESESEGDLLNLTLSRHKEYRVLSLLGKGTSGSVYLVERLADSKKMAIKCINLKEAGGGRLRTSEMTQMLKRMEAYISLFKDLSQHPHRNVVQYYDSFIETSTSELFVVLEYVKGSELADLVR